MATKKCCNISGSDERHVYTRAEVMQLVANGADSYELPGDDALAQLENSMALCEELDAWEEELDAKSDEAAERDWSLFSNIIKMKSAIFEFRNAINERTNNDTLAALDEVDFSALK